MNNFEPLSVFLFILQKYAVFKVNTLQKYSIYLYINTFQYVNTLQ